MVSKYWHVINIGIQNTLVYRMNFFFRSAFGLIPLMATIYLWRAIFQSQDQESVAGYKLAEMISYYLIVTVIDALTAVNEDDWQIAGEIREGTISQFLLKPIDYLGYRLCLFFSGRVIYTAVAIAPIGLFVFFMREYYVALSDPLLWGCFLVSLVLTGLLQFLISYTMAMLAFWVLEVSTFIFILFAFEYIAGGHLFPLDILPPWLSEILRFTPFPYQLFFPASIYLGRTTGAALWEGLAIQLGWVLMFFLVARVVWRRGIRKYAAFGG